MNWKKKNYDLLKCVWFLSEIREITMRKLTSYLVAKTTRMFNALDLIC